MTVQYLKKILNFFCINPHDFLFHIFEENAARVFQEKISVLDDPMRNLVLSEDERFHHKDMQLEERGSPYVIRSFTIDRIQFLKKCNILSEDLVVDIGDSNGIFLKALGKNGISVNISDVVIKSLRDLQIDVVLADAEHLPFQKKSISVVYLFETLEHVSNPIALLNEIGDACSKSLIISIPYVSVTRIHPYRYDPKRPIHEHHIFEFTPEDFRKIISHTPFTIKKEQIVSVLDERGPLIHRLVMFLWRHLLEQDMFCGCFKKFYICYLERKRPEDYPNLTRS
jgi:hypothetical protein